MSDINKNCVSFQTSYEFNPASVLTGAHLLAGCWGHKDDHPGSPALGALRLLEEAVGLMACDAVM